MAREIKMRTAKLLDYRLEKLKFNSLTDNSVYELPDKTPLVLSEEVYSIPESLYSFNVNLVLNLIESLALQRFVEYLQVNDGKNRL
jgi:hypothetical protein